MTPKAGAGRATPTITVALADGGTDSVRRRPPARRAAAASPPWPAPEVIRFRPQDGSATHDTEPAGLGPVQRARWTTTATAAAFSVTVNGKAVSGSFYWAEDDTVLVLDPRYSFKVGSTVTCKVTTARQVGHGHAPRPRPATRTFTVATPTSAGRSPWTGGVASRTSPWYASEVYYLSLMNCTRTGGWVTSGGACSTVDAPHPAGSERACASTPAISNKVSRPYAKYMADHRILDHYLYRHKPHSRLCAAGYCGGRGARTSPRRAAPAQAA